MAAPWPARSTDNSGGGYPNVNPHVSTITPGKGGVGWSSGPGGAEAGGSGSRQISRLDSYVPHTASSSSREALEPGQISPTPRSPPRPDPPAGAVSGGSSSAVAASAPYSRGNLMPERRQTWDDKGKSRSVDYGSSRAPGRGRDSRRDKSGYRSDSSSRSRSRSISRDRDRRKRRYSPRSRDVSPGEYRSPGAGHRRKSPSPHRHGVAGNASLTRYMEDFTRTMHGALLATSAHSLAHAHFSRLQSFISPTNASADLRASLIEADKRAKDAEREMKDMMARTNDAFGDLMFRMGSTKGKAMDYGAFDRDIIKERLAKLEHLTEGIAAGRLAPVKQSDPPPPPPPATEPPPPPPIPADDPCPPPAVAGTAKGEDMGMADEQSGKTMQEKRRLAKDLLRDVLNRLEAVEEARTRMEIRCDDLENIVWENAESDIPVMSWEMLEASRLSFRSIEPMERPAKRVRTDVKDTKEVQTAYKISEVGDLTGAAEDKEMGHAESAGNAQGGSITVEDPKPSATQPSVSVSVNGASAVKNVDEVEALQMKIASLEGQIKGLIDGRAQHDKAIITACLREMKAMLTANVGAEILNALNSMKRSNSIDPGSNAQSSGTRGNQPNQQSPTVHSAPLLPSTVVAPLRRPSSTGQTRSPFIPATAQLPQEQYHQAQPQQTYSINQGHQQQFPPVLKPPTVSSYQNSGSAPMTATSAEAHAQNSAQNVAMVGQMPAAFGLNYPAMSHAGYGTQLTEEQGTQLARYQQWARQKQAAMANASANTSQYYGQQGQQR